MDYYLREQRRYKFNGPNDYFAVRIEDDENFEDYPPPPVFPNKSIDPKTINFHKYVPLPTYNESRWERINNALLHFWLDNFDLESVPWVVQQYAGNIDCSTLRRVLNDNMLASFVTPKAEILLKNKFNYPASNMVQLLKRIASLALAMKRLFFKPIPLLLQATDCSLTLSQEQCACLMANAFFCTFEEHLRNNDPTNPHFNGINCNFLFGCNEAVENDEKLKCLLHYFYRVTTKIPTGTVTFMRTTLHVVPLWHVDNRPLCSLQASSHSLIENKENETHVDFANKFIGGGVLYLGSVQEEIRFLICPEMIVSCLVCERMNNYDAIRIIGAERYSDYVGYAQTLEWRWRPWRINASRDKFGRLNSELIAIDALRYCHYSRQYETVKIRRELAKAYSGFSVVTNTVDDSVPPIATGNWGCGAFNGDPLIQWLAASRAKRELTYLTFGHEQFADELNTLTMRLREADVRISNLYEWIVEYEIHRTRGLRLFDYVYRRLDEEKAIDKALTKVDAQKREKESAAKKSGANSFIQNR